MLLLTAIVAVVQRFPTPVLTPILLVACLAALLGVVVLFVASLLRRGPVRPGDGVLDDVSGVTLRIVECVATVPVEGTGRSQDSIDLVQSRRGHAVLAVLTPNASTWFGRELRTAVDLLNGTRTHRVGFLPRETDRRIAPRLDALSLTGEYVAVPAKVLGTRRPFRVEVGLVEPDRIE